MKKPKDITQNNKKAALLKKLEENYLSYLQGQTKRPDSIVIPPLANTEENVPVYNIEDFSGQQKTKDELKEVIMHLREDPLIDLKRTMEHPSRKPQKQATFDEFEHTRETFERTPRRPAPRKQPESFEMSADDIVKEVEQRVAQKKTSVNSRSESVIEEVNEGDEDREIQEVLATPQRITPQSEKSYEEGIILAFEDGTIGVYVSDVPGQDYDLIYCLRDDGTVDPQGIPLYSYNPKVIGRLPDERLRHLRSRMRWMREEIIYYLKEFEFINLIPSIRTNHRKPDIPQVEESGDDTMVDEYQTLEPRTPVSERSNSLKQKDDSLVRGRKIIIRAPRGQWQAVYWGADNKGPIVAHQTYGKWDLMHLDLSRFADKVEYGDMVPDDVIKLINRDLWK